MRQPVIAVPLLLAVAVAWGGPLLAQPRGPVARMNCREAIELVKREGEVTLTVGGGPQERYVRDRGFCELSEIAELRFVPTRDNPQCPVGYRCREPGFGDWNWD